MQHDQFAMIFILWIIILIEISGIVVMTIVVKFKFTSGKIKKFKDVMYSPEMRKNLVYVYILNNGEFTQIIEIDLYTLIKINFLNKMIIWGLKKFDKSFNEKISKRNRLANYLTKWLVREGFEKP